MTGLGLCVNQEAAEKGKNANWQSLSRQVHEIKPRFNEANIMLFAEKLAKDKLLEAVVSH